MTTLPWIPIASTTGPEGGPATIARVIGMDWASASSDPGVRMLNTYTQRMMSAPRRADLMFVLIDSDNGVRSVWNFEISRARSRIRILRIYSPFVFHPGREEGTLLRRLIYWTLVHILGLDPLSLQDLSQAAQAELYIPTFVPADALEAIKTLQGLQSPNQTLALLKKARGLASFETLDQHTEPGYQSEQWRLYLRGPTIRNLEWNSENGEEPSWILTRTDHTRLSEADNLVDALLQGFAIAQDGENARTNWIAAHTADATFLHDDLLDSYRLLGVPLPYVAPTEELVAWADSAGIL